MSELLTTLAEGSEEDRKRAVRDMMCLHHGCPELRMHRRWMDPPREARVKAIRAVADGIIGTRAKIIVPALRKALA